MSRAATCRVGGFTLMECVVALALVALLVSLAAPSWTQAWGKAKRLEAISALWRLQQLQEQYRWRTGAYASEVHMLLGTSAASGPEAQSYALEVAQAGVHGYTLVARSRAGSAAQQDATCHTLALRQYRGEFSRGSACPSCDMPHWAESDGARLTDPARCWGA